MQLSVLVVSYNHEKYIKECIDSIISQDTPFEYEIVVTDDCSNDSTISIIEKSLNHSGLPYKIQNNKTNVGLVKNYQKGFSACKGEYIAIIEGDDYWKDNKRLYKLVNFMNAHQECAMVFNSVIVYNEKEDKFLNPEKVGTDNFEYISTNELAAGKKFIGNLSSCVFRQSVIKKLKPDLFELPVADWMLSMVVSQFGKIAHLFEPMSVYRKHSYGVWTRMTRKEQLYKMINLIDDYNKYLEYNFDKEFSSYKSILIDEINARKNLKGFFKYLLNKLIKIMIMVTPKKLRQKITYLLFKKK